MRKGSEAIAATVAVIIVRTGDMVVDTVEVAQVVIIITAT